MAEQTKFQKHTLNLRAGDWAYLAEVYTESIGRPVSSVIQQLVSRHVDRLRSATRNEIDEEVEIEL